MRFIGQPLPRQEDARFLRGEACFVDDLRPAGTLHAVLLRSAHAHARILGMDAAAALATPGVRGLITAADIAELPAEIPLRLAPLEGFERLLQRPLAADRVRFVGEPLAVLVAQDRALAEDALDRIQVEYEPLPASVGPDPAGTPLFPEYGSNLANRYLAGRGDPDRAFAEADLVIRRSFHAHRHGAAPLETRGLLAVPEADGVLRVYGATKVTQFNRRALARMLGRAEDSLDLVEVDVGGSFGARGEFYPEDFLIPFAALRFGAPVKWIEDRREHLLTCNHSREIDADVELALRRDGSFLGLRATLRADMGAYIRTNGGVVPAKAGQFLPGPYRIPHVALTVESWFTNKTPIGTLRGPGRYETHFFRERLIDIAATDLGLDPAEIRLRNLLTPEEMPYDTGRLVPYEPPSAFDSGDFPQGLRTALEALGYAELKAQAGKPGPDGRRHGIGLACFAESSGAGPSETARVTLCPDGRIEVATGISTSGQGHETVLAQICAESFGGAVPPRDITILHGTASIMPQGFGTYHSRAVVVGGSAILRAAEALRARLLAVAGERLQLRAAELTLREGGVWREGGTAPLADMATLAAWAPEASATETFPMPKRTYTCGAHAAHVAVDVETGQVEVLRYIAVEDVGRAINPLLVHGQAVGAAVQGIGATFLDEYVYDAEGQLLTGSLADYLLPTATCFPHVEAITLEEAPSALNPLGAKGAGEGGIVACGAAIANAVASALGADVTVLPLSPDRVLRLIPEEAAAT